jgi:hypothetical protein
MSKGMDDLRSCKNVIEFLHLFCVSKIRVPPLKESSWSYRRVPSSASVFFVVLLLGHDFSLASLCAIQVLWRRSLRKFSLASFLLWAEAGFLFYFLPCLLPSVSSVFPTVRRAGQRFFSCSRSLCARDIRSPALVIWILAPAICRCQLAARAHPDMSHARVWSWCSVLWCWLLQDFLPRNIFALCLHRRPRSVPAQRAWFLFVCLCSEFISVAACLVVHRSALVD